jgi:hypothetical protein
MKIWMQNHGDVVNIAKQAKVSRQTVYLVIEGKSQHPAVKEAIAKLNAERFKVAQEDFQRAQEFQKTLAALATAHEVPLQ